MIFRIAGWPPRNFYSDPALALPAGEASHQSLVSVGALNSSAEGELSNLTVTLGMAARKLYAAPPLGAAAVLSDATGTLHSGRVVRVAWVTEGVAVDVQP